jgi:hypothetical protein
MVARMAIDSETDDGKRLMKSVVVDFSQCEFPCASTPSQDVPEPSAPTYELILYL